MNNDINRSEKLLRIGEIMIRYGLVIILLWVGLLKFMPYEAEGIKPLVENSPIMSWGYDIMSIKGFAIVTGIIEILLAIMIASRAISPRISAIGSFGAIILFLITLSFLLSTPGVWQKGEGFPFLSPMPGQFLAKDLMLLGAAIWTAGEALIAARIKKT
jgi:uncharacterized membrane protein YkgB